MALPGAQAGDTLLTTAPIARPAPTTGRGWTAWTTLAVLLMSAIFWTAAARSSIVIDGSRYTFLDDDQMISMRYARNLAEGRGLVWNDGERVEGYTNFGWVLVMAAVHRLGTPDRLASLWVKAINWLLCCVVLVQSSRLVRRLAREAPHAVPLAAGTLAVGSDLLFWGVNGFETTLLTALVVASCIAVLDAMHTGRLSAAAGLLVGAIPLVRSDAHLLAAGIAMLALVVVPSRRTLLVLGIAAALPLGHEIFRLAYYGQWLPNTYYLKVDGNGPSVVRALPYLKRFVQAYGVVLVLAAGSMLVDGHARWLLVPAAAAVGHVLLVGADIFQYHRFLAPVVPLLVAIACATAARAGGSRLASTLLMASMLVSTVFQVGVHGRSTLSLLESPNGLPRQGVVTGWMIDRYTSTAATVAVLPAGNIGYFSRRTAIDLLGKSEAHIARLPPHAGAPIGHNKFDMSYGLGRQPDLVVSFWPASHTAGIDELVREGVTNPDRDYGTALLTHPVFRTHYASNVVPDEYLLKHNAVYVRDTSPERERIGGWRAPRLE